MLTAPSWIEHRTELRTYADSVSPWRPAEIRRAVADTRHLLRFRGGTVRKPKVVRTAVAVLVAITLAAVVGPLLASGAGDADGMAFNVLLLMPTMMVGFLGLAVASAIASGGGRELLSGESAVAYPVSPTTDHLGALLMAPLNIAWMLQAWFLLGAASYGRGTTDLGWLLAIVVLWIVAATTLAQVIGWCAEAVRRRPHGVATVRLTGVALAGLMAWLQLSDRLFDVLDAVPTLQLLMAGLSGFSVRWCLAALALLAITAVSLLLGGWAAHVAARRMPRDELKAESTAHEARPNPRGVLAMLVRIDRASVWRAVPMRRGMLVLAIGPGLVAFAGALEWSNVVILPGLVVSGGVLLFGVNIWSLDGRGGLWRESLPVDAITVFRARSWVLAEWLLLASLITVGLASLRAGVPTAGEMAAIVCTVLVVTAQVVAVSMSWSIRRPFAVNLRSARATPAPPTVMIGYSAKLALSTTLTAMVFSTAATVAAPWWLIVLLASPFLAWSALRWRRAAKVWSDPVARAGVVTTVAS
ncbi:hypothetical protein [Nocardioides gilvus]|uniref:hypothetical protein n=1 Tax=Nocardioides gilvus TaxID=1735589 RepID=UPI000D749FA8|nr:hypothetical protein [Nocardioides gilvus]